MKMQKYYIETLGCLQNEYDASKLSNWLQLYGFVESSAKESEIVFILACSIRQTAVDRIFGRIENWLGKKIIITSCLTPDDQKKIIEKGAYYWKFGDKKSLFSIIENQLLVDSRLRGNDPTSPFGLRGANRGESGNDPSTLLGAGNETLKQYNNYPYVPIMSGCNNFCSYCIVPYTRGRERSRPMATIIDEISQLVKQGKREITLLGQNVNSYIITNNEKLITNNHNPKLKTTRSDFAELLMKVNDIEGDFKVGFMSNHPKDMTGEIIEAIATLPKIKKEIHLPAQSGSDKILTAMNRPYSIRQYLRIVENLKFKIQNLVITTDIIVGFPGETEGDFQKTVDLCKKIIFDSAYINKYSPRKGTTAYNLGDPVSWSEKQRRWRVLNEIVNR